MANEQNLIQNKERTPSERRENAQKAGKASGIVRRKKKTMKAAMNTLLALDVGENNKEKLSQLGIEDKDMNNQMLMMVSMFRKAVSGDVGAMRLIMDITGSHTMSELDKQKLKLEKERLKLEKEKATPTENADTKENMNAIRGILSQMQELREDE